VIILDKNVEYGNVADLPKLYGLTAKALNIGPSEQTEPIIKHVLGGCIAVVDGICAMRNKLGHAHGKRKTEVQPEPRHAKLAVNLARAASTFLVQSWELQR